MYKNILTDMVVQLHYFYIFILSVALKLKICEIILDFSWRLIEIYENDF